MRTPSRAAHQSRRSGQTLVIALIILGVLLAVGLVFLGIVGRNVQQTSFNRQRSAASDLAVSGIRFAHQQLLRTIAGADWRPDLTQVQESPADYTRDPDILYLRPGTGLGFRSDSDPQKDEGGPDGLGPYTRLLFQNGRALIRVRYAPSDANIFSTEATGPLRNPGRARDYTIIESVGRFGPLSFNDPTSGNSGGTVQFQNFADGNAFRNALGTMRRLDSLITPSSKQIAFASIGIIESAMYITNKYKVSRPAEFGIPSGLGAVYKGVSVADGKNLSGTQVSAPLTFLMGIEVPMYNLGNPPTPSAGPIGVGGSLFSNADVRINGTVRTKLNAPLGDDWLIHGLLYGADNESTLEVEANDVNGSGTWVSPVPLSVLTNASNPSLNSRSADYSTLGGLIRDAVVQSDNNGYQRGVGVKEAPSGFVQDPDTGLTRYVQGTRESGSLIGSGNSGRYGYGSGFYLDNFSDRQSPPDEEGRARVGTSQSLAFDWLNPNNGQSGSGWQGSFYVPRGAYVILKYDGFTIARDSKAPADQRYWKGPDGGAPVDNLGRPVQTSVIRYRLGPGGDGLIHIINTFTPDRVDPTKAIDINAASPDFDSGPVFNGTLYFEGNIRIRGVIPTDIQMTVVSGGTIYIEGSITKGITLASGSRLTRPSQSMLMLIAHDYVTLNTTQFFGSSPDQSLEPVNDTQSAIAYNPVRMRVGGQPLKFIYELALNSAFNPADPSTWRPFGLDYREFVNTASDTGPTLPTRLLLTHTMDDGPAPATFFGMDVNFGLDNPTSANNNATGPVYDWTYEFLMSDSNAATQPYLDAGTAANSYIPMYGLGVEAWQRYSRFESIGFPLIESDFTYDATNGYLLEGNMPPGGGPPDPQGSYTQYTDATNEIQFSHQNAGTDPTNDYLLSRAALVPGDIQIQASLYAEEGSFFVIPGPSFNPNPNDRREVFDQAVANYGGETVAQAIRQAQQERLENFGSFPETPFYGEPLDVRIVIEGSISQNMPAPIDQQAQWVKKWGWIPAQEGGLYDLSGSQPRPVLIPKSHVPAGYNINPAAGGTDLFVPNLIVSYDPALATARINGFDNSVSNTAIREDGYGRTLPPLPRLPVSPTLAYFGEVNP